MPFQAVGRLEVLEAADMVRQQFEMKKMLILSMISFIYPFQEEADTVDMENNWQILGWNQNTSRVDNKIQKK